MFRVKKVHIEKFRKLNDLSFELGEKITVIAGHNGVGKSNLLSLIASGSGTKSFKTHDNTAFHPQFEDYFKIYENEVDKNYESYLKYDHTEKDSGNNFSFSKRMALKNDTVGNRGIRIIPRGHNHFDESGLTIKETNEIVKEKTGVGQSGRIDMPTMFVSLSRLYPLGEGEITEETLDKRTKIMQNGANDKFKEWYNSVIPGAIKENEEELRIMKKKNTSRSSLVVPLEGTETQSQSIGQDSLGNIISALVDFYMISNEDDYHGGLLCIDEVGVSLHPNAQIKLIDLLKRLSVELNLQIIVSSHSLTILEEILRLNNENAEYYKLVYLKNSTNPFVANISNFSELKADLYLEQHPMPPRVKIYFEDEAASQLFGLLKKLNEELLDKDERFQLALHEEISVYLGKNQLLSLAEVDDYFKNICFILDGDARINRNTPEIRDHLEGDLEFKGESDLQRGRNVIFLPSYFPPESYLYRIIYNYVHNEHDHQMFWRNLDTQTDTKSFTPEFIKEHYLFNCKFQV